MSLLGLLSLMIPAHAGTVTPSDNLCSAIQNASPGSTLSLTAGTHTIGVCDVNRGYNASTVWVQAASGVPATDVIIRPSSNSNDYLFKLRGGFNVTLKKLTLESGDKQTILAEATTLKIENVTFKQNTQLTSINPSSGGGGLKITGSTSVTATDTVFMGMVVGGSSPTDTNNGDKDDGGGVYMDSNSATFSCTRCSFTDLSADHGGAIYIKNASRLDLVDSIFTDTIANGNGSAAQGGALYLGSVPTVVLSGTTFTRSSTINAGTHQGGAIYVSEGVNFSMTGGSFDNGALTSATSSQGGWIYFADTNTATIDGTVFTGGKATAGGCIYATSNNGSDSLSIANASFDGCSATGTGGSDGGGAILASGSGSLSLTATDFLNNSTAKHGGGARLALGGATAITEGSWCGNSASGDGGGLWAASNSTSSLDRVIFNGNDAGGSGGGVYLGGDDGYMVQSYLTHNSAGSAGAGLWVSGGGAGFTVESTLVAWQTGSDAITPGGTFSEDYNDFFGNANADVTGLMLFGLNDLIATDPLLVNHAGTCLSGDLAPTPLTSPLLDAGPQPSVPGGPLPSTLPYSSYPDIDGTPNIGPFPGEGSDPSDMDGDGIKNADYYANNPPSGDPKRLIDCDDADPAVGARLAWYADADADSYGDLAATPSYALATPAGICTESPPAGAVRDHTDCDDARNLVHPGGTELCSTPYDDNCDGFINESTAADAKSWYPDADVDAYGDKTATPTPSCDAPLGVTNPTLDHTDCDDGNALASPALAELCVTTFDDNCNGVINESTATDVSSWWPDNDADAFGDQTATATPSCTQPSGFANNNLDCNDNSNSINPSTPWYPDVDNDSYGDANASPFATCEQPADHVLDHTDCNDNDGAIHPQTIWYKDKDGDTFGDPNTTKTQCSQPSGYVLNAFDCNDNDPTIGGESLWFRDGDGDGYGDPAKPSTICGNPGAGWVANKDDCDDSKVGVRPGATEVPGNGIDEDCDGQGGPDSDDDGDGISWFNENRVGGSDNSIDTDGDGVLDGVEYGANGRDTDGDGKADINDTDDDNDGVPTSVERGTGTTARNTDGDALPDYRDTDDDGDGVLTVDEDRNRDGDPRNDDLDGDGIFDYLDDDDDGDGIPNLDETRWGANSSDPLNPDTDGDSIPDGAEWDDWMAGTCDDGTTQDLYDGVPCVLTVGPQDFDGDGIPDILDTDDDNDGISSRIEGSGDIDGTNAPDCDLGPDPSQAYCEQAPDGIPNYHDDDSDGDGKLDIDEYLGDADDDGTRNFKDCNDCDGCNGDADGDGLNNCEEALLGTDPTLTDSDSDGISDFIEVGAARTSTDAPDWDGDGLIDAIDPDDDNDGVNTYLEVRTADGQVRPDLDTDNDGTPDRYDLDDDDDGVPTALEYRGDTDEDGLRDRLDPDDDGDGIPTIDEDLNGNGDWFDDDDDGDKTTAFLDDDPYDGPTADTDGDGLTNQLEEERGYDPFDPDSDGDGIPDGVEDPFGQGLNADGDDLVDALDPDDDDDGVLTADEGSFDADGDGIPNYLDTDSDGDGTSDGEEQVDYEGERVDADSDCDGAIDRLDAVDDGLCERDTSATRPQDTVIPPPKGCECTSGAVRGPWWLGLFALALLRRREDPTAP